MITADLSATFSPGTPVLVTGAAGFVGRHLVNALLARGFEVVALCRRAADLENLSHPALRIEVGDLRDAATRARLVAGRETVIHLAAARSRLRGSRAEMAAVNETATIDLARRACDAGTKRFVWLSTALVFGPSATPLDELAPLVEDTFFSAYVVSKARAVRELRELAARGAPVVILHPSIVYGPDRPERPNRVTAQIRRLLERRIDFVLDGGTARRDLVHVADVVEAIQSAAAMPAALGQEILITGEPIGQRVLGELVAHCASRPRPLVISAPLRFSRWAATIGDRVGGIDARCGLTAAVEMLAGEWLFRSLRARAMLNFNPRPLAQGIAETVEWIRSGRDDQ
ncbi:MAG: NAD-dependent epimerase/dehydratase family protein [Thermoanaerobaculia bacterium]